ncbi:MAG: glycosyltransferase [Epsilonproteobacteria bacterium]|nr:glycosyltransferase [Campylobacterota bacterium]
MIIYYKNETNLTKYLESKHQISLYKDGGFLTKIGFKKRVYPDIYFHSGGLSELSIRLIVNSKVTIVNSTILKDKICKTLGIDGEKIDVILPAYEPKEYKKKEVQKAFKEEHNIDKNTKIIYFTAKDFMKNGFSQFISIINNLEMMNWKVVISTKDEKQKIYAKELLQHHKLLDDVLIIEDESFDVADIFVLPTSLENFSISVLKAMANKCIVFSTTNNNAIEIMDVFSIMTSPKDSNTSYKIDMLLRVKDEMKKIKKENFEVASKLTYDYQQKKLNQIIEKLAL